MSAVIASADGDVRPEEACATKTGAQILWEVLVEEGVRTVFGYPGGAIMPAYDAMAAYPIHHVLVRHEQGASHMADGYARASGEVGVAIATSGPGATNLVTGLATAMLDSIPMVCITGQVPSHLIGSDAFQETDITGVTLPITKHNFLATDVNELARCLREAFYIARSGRPGPVVVDITKDVQLASAPHAPSRGPLRLPGYRPPPPPLDRDLEAALALIDGAQRPVVLAGHGIVKASATGALLEFVRRADVPVASTLLGLGGFPASHPQALGMMGMHGEAWVNQAIQEADLLIALGMRFDDRVTGNPATFAPHAKKIHVELDPAEIDKNVKVDVALVGDVREVLTALVPRVRETRRAAWTRRVALLRDDAQRRDVVFGGEGQGEGDAGALHPAQVIHDLYRLTDDDAIIVTDVGQHQMWEAQYYPHERPRTLLTSGGLGTMGFALPAAIGARFAHPEREIWVIAGDGGFQMTAPELSTCAQEGIKLHIAIINNGFLGMVRQWQEMFYDKRYVATPMLAPDFVKLAEAHGVRGARVQQRGELEATVQAARAFEGTTVIDFRVTEEACVYPMVASGRDLDDMIRRPLRALPATEPGEESNDA